MMGMSVANCTINPGKEFWEANADGEGEALLLKAQFDGRLRGGNE